MCYRDQKKLMICLPSLMMVFDVGKGEGRRKGRVNNSFMHTHIYVLQGSELEVDDLFAKPGDDM